MTMTLRNLTALAAALVLMQPVVSPVSAGAFELPDHNEAEVEGLKVCGSRNEKLDLSVGLLSLQYKGLRSLIEDQKKDVEALVDQCPTCSKKTLAAGIVLAAGGNIAGAISLVELGLGYVRMLRGVPSPATAIITLSASIVSSAVGIAMVGDYTETYNRTHPIGRENQLALEGSQIPREVAVPGRQGFDLNSDRLLNSVKNYLVVSADQRRVHFQHPLEERRSNAEGDLAIGEKLKVPFGKIAYLSGEAEALSKAMAKLQVPCRYRKAYMRDRSARPNQQVGIDLPRTTANATH